MTRLETVQAEFESRDADDDRFEHRWARWQARGRAQTRRTEQRAVALLAGALAAAAMFATWRLFVM